jgi:hypothetical protein
MTTFPNQIDDCPVSLTNLNIVDLLGCEFCSSQTAAKKNGNHRKVTLVSKPDTVRFFDE